MNDYPGDRIGERVSSGVALRRDVEAVRATLVSHWYSSNRPMQRRRLLEEMAKRLDKARAAYVDDNVPPALGDEHLDAVRAILAEVLR